MEMEMEKINFTKFSLPSLLVSKAGIWEPAICSIPYCPKIKYKTKIKSLLIRITCHNDWFAKILKHEGQGGAGVGEGVGAVEDHKPAQGDEDAHDADEDGFCS